MIVVKHSFRHRPVINSRILLKALRENYVLVLFSLSLIIGMIFGAVFARNADFTALNKLDFLFYSNYKARAVQPIISIFSASFASSFIFILACFLCGLSVWGMFIIPAVLFFRGFGLGLTSGYLYAAYGFMGVLFNLVVILPGAFVCCLAILLAAREGTRFSRMIASCSVVSQRGTISPPKMKPYLLNFGVILMVAFLAAVIDVIFSGCFAGMFSF
ncbi:stage II sporulation protein M [Clostridium sp. KNHs216]|uniref:stage II sporulation protein M n=1 Tax=Eubacteriales TaxID=186802 RepID=UPI001151EFC1|nr:stage II sporulation protein M [Clostridium sp. KNHs216]TQI65731.1 stage II sporulation protein M [Clostridium sp. KNHs216]